MAQLEAQVLPAADQQALRLQRVQDQVQAGARVRLRLAVQRSPLPGTPLPEVPRREPARPEEQVWAHTQRVLVSAQLLQQEEQRQRAQPGAAEAEEEAPPLVSNGLPLRPLLWRFFQLRTVASAAASAAASSRKCLRTFSAAASSMELE